MYRFLFSPRWLGFHLLVIVGIVTMVNLGFWQLRRLDERKAFNAQVSERIADPPAPLDDVLTAGADPDSVEWRSVTARGTYLPAEQFLVVNRSQDGIGGTMVVTPMQLADGRVLLVERGFMPGTTPPPAAPSGTVDVVGRLRPSEERRTGQLSDPKEGELKEAQRVDIARLAAAALGPAGADVHRAHRLAPGRADAVPGAGHAARADRRTAPVVRRAVVHVLGGRRRRVGVGRAQVAQDQAPRGSTTNRRRHARGSRRSTAVIVRVTSRGEASMRRYGAHTSTGRSKKASKNVASSS